MIRCRSARRSIEEAFERDLALEERLSLEAHLSQCAACAALARRSRSLQELLEASGDLVPPVPDVAAARERVFAALERGEGAVFRPRRASRRALTAVAVLLAAGAIVVFELRVPRPALVAAPVPLAENPRIPSTADWTAEGVEAEVRALLLADFATGGLDEARARERFFQATREAARAGWPVRRFVEALLDSPDAHVALAAVRCLAILGESSVAPALERTLARPELVDVALDALGGLASDGEAGAPAFSALERSLQSPALGPRALLQLCRVGGARAARAIVDAVERADTGAIPSREALLDALTTTGPAAVESLLRLAETRARDEAGEILARLALVADAGPELVRILEHERLDDELAQRALRVLLPSEALPWLEERCASARERGPALATLASYSGLAPLASAVRLAHVGRVSRRDALELVTTLLERDAERGAEYSRTLAPPAELAVTWLELLLESGAPCTAPALVPLVFSALLSEDDRRWAALAVGEVGTRAEGEALIQALRPRFALDLRTSAACLISIQALTGPEGVTRVLEGCSRSCVRRILAVFEGPARGGEAINLHRVARLLDAAREELASTSSERKAFL